VDQHSSSWVNDGNAAMLTDLYELTMLESYSAHGMNDIAVFDLFVRRLPKTRNYLVACGLEDVLHYLETFSFSTEHLSLRIPANPTSDSDLKASTVPTQSIQCVRRLRRWSEHHFRSGRLRSNSNPFLVEPDIL